MIRKVGFHIIGVVSGMSSRFVLGIHFVKRILYKSDREITESYARDGILSAIDNHNWKENKVRVVSENKNLKKEVLVVFVHGAPGGIDAFSSYMKDEKLRSHARLVSYDRPGYGNWKGGALTSIREQAEVLASIINKYRSKEVVLVGYSYGAAIIANLTARCPDLVDRAIMVAPVIDPDNEKIFWFSYLAKWKVSKYFLPSNFQVAGDEKFTHSDELHLMRDLWKDIKKPVIHIHGTTDMLAPSHDNIQWSKNNIPTKYLDLIILEDEGHLVLWKQFDVVKKAILSGIAV